MKLGMSDAYLLNPEIPEGLESIDVSLVDGLSPELTDLVTVVHGDHDLFEIPIVPWPVSGNRPLDPDTGACAGVTEGWFSCNWLEGRLVGQNDAVEGKYVIGFAADGPSEAPTSVDLWHMNYHPDSGQLFYSAERAPFIVPVIPAGEDPDLSKIKGIYCDGSYGLCLLPGVWHEGAFPIGGSGRFFTRQGRVHGRVSVDLGKEFGCLLRVPLKIFKEKTKLF